MSIKAINTKHNGYNFRSRLEARWAVFFDALTIKYDYELEGYTLSNGRNYLPDFFLPNYYFMGFQSNAAINGTFAEVKHRFSEREKDVCRKLCKDLKCDILLLEGTPDKVNYTLLQYVDVPEEDRIMLDEYDINAEFSFVFGIDIAFETDKMIHGGADYGEFSYTPDAMERAIVVARSKRFEFGGE